MTLRLVTAPTAPVVTLAELKAHLRVDGDDEDTRIQALERAAVAHLDGWRGVLGRAIMPQTWAQEFRDWGDLRLAMPDASAITVTYRDAAGEMQAATGVTARLTGHGPVVTATGPNTDLISVQFACAMPDTLIEAARTAVKLYVDHLYDRADLSPAFGAMVAAMRWRAP